MSDLLDTLNEAFESAGAEVEGVLGELAPPGTDFKALMAAVKGQSTAGDGKKMKKRQISSKK